jgi:hypothetical protein
VDRRRGTAALRGPLKVNIPQNRHGFGNWSEIADFIGSNKSKEDVEEHYLATFLETPEFLPVIDPLSRLQILYLKGMRREGLLKPSKKIPIKKQINQSAEAPTPIAYNPSVLILPSRKRLLDRQPAHEQCKDRFKPRGDRRVYAKERRLRGGIR